MRHRGAALQGPLLAVPEQSAEDTPRSGNNWRRTSDRVFGRIRRGVLPVNSLAGSHATRRGFCCLLRFPSRWVFLFSVPPRGLSPELVGTRVGRAKESWGSGNGAGGVEREEGGRENERAGEARNEERTFQNATSFDICFLYCGSTVGRAVLHLFSLRSLWLFAVPLPCKRALCLVVSAASAVC